jgi:tetratricopeptide (TPR) repeat protein
MESFTELQRRVFALYREKRFAEALQTLEGAASTLPDYARLTYWKACFLCLQGQSEAALQALQEGLERGLWYSQTRLADPDLAPIQGRPEFQAILEESERRSQTAQTSVQTKLRVFPPRYLDSSTPLLMAFHMKGANLEETAPHWVSAAERGAFVAVLQSDQLDGPNEYGWGDYPRAKQAAQKAFAVLKTQHPFNPDYVVMGGASQGAGLAVRLTLEAALPSRGFIAVVGAGPLEPLLPHVGPSVKRA